LKKRKISKFWDVFAQGILSNKIAVTLFLIIATIGLVSQWGNIGFSFTEANLLPDKHEINVEYRKFLDKFGEEGVVIVMAINDESIYTPKKFNAWNQLNKQIDKFSEVDFVVSFSEMKELTRKEDPKSFALQPISTVENFTQKDIDYYKNKLLNELPFYKGLIYSGSKKTIQSALYIRQDVVNTRGRRDFILEKLNPLLQAFEKDQNIDLKVSGMPYIRTMNSKNIFDEMKLFLGVALLITSGLFFFFFRSAGVCASQEPRSLFWTGKATRRGRGRSTSRGLRGKGRASSGVCRLSRIPKGFTIARDLIWGSVAIKPRPSDVLFCLRKPRMTALRIISWAAAVPTSANFSRLVTSNMYIPVGVLPSRTMCLSAVLQCPGAHVDPLASRAFHEVRGHQHGAPHGGPGRLDLALYCWQARKLLAMRTHSFFLHLPSSGVASQMCMPVDISDARRLRRSFRSPHGLV